jgi:hypothetical protein
MKQRVHNVPNIVLLRGAALWLLMALLLAWCMVGLNLGVPFLKAIFAGKQTRLLQSHIDFLLMTALILGFYAARVPLHWTVRWAMVIGAFGNSSLFLLQSIFPELDTPVPPEGLFPAIPLSDGKHFDDNLWVWRGGNHSLLVNVPGRSRNFDRRGRLRSVGAIDTFHDRILVRASRSEPQEPNTTAADPHGIFSRHLDTVLPWV